MNALLPLVLVCAFPDAEPPVSAPKGVAPTLVVASVRGSELVIPRTVVQMVPVAVVEKRMQGGMVVEVMVTKYQSVVTEQMTVVKLEGSTAARAGGGKIDAADLKKLLAKPTLVALAPAGVALDKNWLAALRKDLIVITPAAPTAGTTTPPTPPVEIKK